MTSSMLSGERRWASSRRGGMTVLGKVAVPKPINLPSQRLENHGLDPNVEIVPKGTLGWGGRSSSSASNAWGSSLSPNTDGSPSHLTARPSSGGSGTRPSTAGSDRAPEPTTNAWGSNSRPSSASGSLTSNQTSLTSLRPRSAETRPGSSQLSRFADSLTESSVGWSAARTAEKLGVTQSRNEEFSLSSGDFPTLGSEKDKSVKNSDLQDCSSHVRPGSSSGLGNVKTETSVDDIPVNENAKGESISSSRKDYPPSSDNGVRPIIEKWQGNPQPYPNPDMPTQHYDAWHGPPVNNPQGGVWFRGPPGGPPFGNPVAPAVFPIKPFPYYSPHIPPSGLANPPPVPPPVAGPRGNHPKNGDVYRPHMPEAFLHPGIPVRPGFYPGPVTFEGYYSRPMGYCNSTERDVPFMGIPAGPSVYNRYSNQNPPESSNLQGRSGGYGSAAKPLTSEQVESSHPPDSGGPYRVLLKQHSEWDGKHEPSNWEDSETTNASYVDGREPPRMPVWESDQRSDYRRNEEMDLRTSAHGEEASSQTFENQGSSSASVVRAKSSESTRSIKTSDSIPARKLDSAASGVQESLRPHASKDSSLIQKIEGLNAKARDNSSARRREEQRNKFHGGGASVNHVENEVGADARVVFTEKAHAIEVRNLPSCELGAPGGEDNPESLSFNGAATSRRTAHGMQGRADHRNKGKSKTQDSDGWRKKSVVADSSAPSSARLEGSNVFVGDHRISVENCDRSVSYQSRCDGEPVQTMTDPTDSLAQHTKMKEFAEQRTKQLQEEEEGWTRKQKAKALAKLGELSRRTKAVEVSTQKENATTLALQIKQEDLQPSGPTTVSGKSGRVNLVETSINKVERSSFLSSEPPSETMKSDYNEHVLSCEPVTLHKDVSSVEATNAERVHNNIASKQKRMGYKQKQNLPLEKTFNEKLVSTALPAPKVENDAVADVIVSSVIVTNEVSSTCGSGLHIKSAAMAESSMNQKKKNNRNGRNKHKVEEALSLPALPLPIPKETHASQSSVDSDKPKASEFELDQDLVQLASFSEDPNQYSEQRRYLPNEESHVRTNSQWKSQHSRRMPRNIQANRPAEKSPGSDAVMWAPVKLQNKTEVTDESSNISKSKADNPVKSEQHVNNLKNKRAEMERYIPKPAAKEMAQQGSVQQQVASAASQVHMDESVGRADPGSQGLQISRHSNLAVGKVSSGMDSRNGSSRLTKQERARGSWRQWVSTESTNVHDIEEQDGLYHNTNSNQNVQRSTEHQQAQKSDMSSVKGQTKHFRNSSDPDGSNSSTHHDSAALASVPVARDQTAASRGRQVTFKGHKGTGVNHDVDHKKIVGETEEIETQVSSSEPSPMDAGGTTFKENRGVGERLMSHWQPKSQASNNQRANRSNDQNVGSDFGQVSKKDSTPHCSVSLPAGCDKEINSHVTQPHHDPSVSEKNKAGDAVNSGNQESKRERRNAPPRGRPHSLDQVPVSSFKQAQTNMDPRHEQRQVPVSSFEQVQTNMDPIREQRPLSGFRRNGNQNRFGRGHESRGDWKSPGQDNRHYSQPTNRERQGLNLHYEYHPVGPYDNSKSDNSEKPGDGNHTRGRFRERGQTHSRRDGANFY